MTLDDLRKYHHGDLLMVRGRDFEMLVEVYHPYYKAYPEIYTFGDECSINNLEEIFHWRKVRLVFDD